MKIYTLGIVFTFTLHSKKILSLSPLNSMSVEAQNSDEGAACIVHLYKRYDMNHRLLPEQETTIQGGAACIVYLYEQYDMNHILITRHLMVILGRK